MSEFNENPFKKDTPVIVFSSGLDFEVWSERNCEKCKRDNCKMKKHFENPDGTFPLWAAKEIGCKYDPLHQTADLQAYCSKLHFGEGVNF